MGIAEAVEDAILSCSEWMQPLLWSNICLLGGNTAIPNFSTRLEREVRKLAPSECRVKIYSAKE